MTSVPPTLNYGVRPKPGWTRLTRWVLGLVITVPAVAGLWWATSAASKAWGRYRIQYDRQAAEAALSAYAPHPAVVLDPAAGPVTYMKPFKSANGHGQFLTLKIPADPVLERHLRWMHRFSSLNAYPLATTLQTGHGPSFVLASIEVRDVVGGPPLIWLHLTDEQFRPGTFPGYRFSVSGYGSGMHLRGWNGQALPTVMTGRVDPGGKGWTLPLLVNGRPEWVHFDHSGPKWPRVTSSFGRLTQSGSQWDLDY